MPPTTNADSEDDLDYVPPADDHDSDCSDEQDKVEHTTERAPPETDPEKKKQRDALWASFQASISTPPPSLSNGPSPQLPPVKRVKIEKTYLFAGKYVTDVVEVPEDSEEAKKWPRWSPPSPCHTSQTASASTSGSSSGKRQEEDKDDSSAPPLAVDSSPAAPTIATSTPRVKRPEPRKPRTVLPSVPKASHAKKITTLDKSAMDWHAHVASQTSDVKDELDTNRRGGGYLEKLDFLKRVQDRKEDAFEASKSNKRRKA